MSYHVKTTLCHDITTYDISWQPYKEVIDSMQGHPCTVQDAIYSHPIDIHNCVLVIQVER